MHRNLNSFLDDQREELTVKNQAGGYRLHSGIIQDRFISIWPLIHDFEKYELLIKLLCDELTSRCKEHSIDVIAGCSSTILHLLEGIKSKLFGICDVLYLGTHPLQSDPDKIKERLASKRVLILTDVISSGSLLVETSHLIVNLEGIPICVEALYLAYNERIPSRITRSSCLEVLKEDEISPYRRAYRGSAGLVELPLTLHSKCYVGVLDGNYGSECLEIDVESVYPRSRSIVEDIAFRPQMTLSDFVCEQQSALHDAHGRLEKSRELSLGYFRNRGKTFSVFVDISSLVRANIEQIKQQVIGWNQKNNTAAGSLIVTTPTNENRQLMSLLKSELVNNNIEVEIASFSKYDELDGSFPYLLSESRNSLGGKSALVLLSTVHSSNTLRALTALLSLYGCARIDTLVILNRMTPASASFLSRIAQIGDMKKQTETNFHFDSLIRIWDLAPSDLKRVEASITARYRDFTMLCDAPSLKAAAATDLKYFHPEDLQDDIEKSSIVGAGRPSTQETLLVTRALEELIKHRSISPMIELLGNLDLSKRGLFSVYLYLMSDFNRLTSRHYREAITRKFGERLHGITNMIEEHHNKKMLAGSNLIEYEKATLTGCAIFSLLFTKENGEFPGQENASSSRQSVDDILLGICDHPNNPQVLFRLYDIGWCFSFVFAVVMMSTERVSQGALVEAKKSMQSTEGWILFIDTLNRLRTQLSTIVRQGAKIESWEDWFKDFVKQLYGTNEIDSDNTPGVIFIPQYLLTNVTAILDTFSAVDDMTLGYCLRIIRREIAWPRPKHSHIGRVLSESPVLLKIQYDETKSSHIGRYWELRKMEDANSALFVVNDMLVGIRRLKEIRRLIVRLLRETLTIEEWIGYFCETGEGTMDNQLDLLDDILSNARDNHRLSKSDLPRIADLTEKLCNALWGSSDLRGLNQTNASGFFRYLSSYECNVHQLLQHLVSPVSSENNGEDVQKDIDLVWEIDSDGTEKGCYVLCEPKLLHMALDNFVDNFKYADVDGTLTAKGRVTVRGKSENIHGSAANEKDRLEIEFANPAREDPGEIPQNTTSNDHRLRLESFGCELKRNYRKSSGEFVLILNVPRIVKRGV